MPKSDNEGRGGSDTTEDVGTGFIEPIEIQEEMERSFLEYSMSVIVSRALPDVRDNGLKPVHRRILYSRDDQRLLPDRPHSKCAKVVGDVMVSTTPTANRSSTPPWSAWPGLLVRYALMDGQGNFGGTGPDERPAAMRYTEARIGPPRWK